MTTTYPYGLEYVRQLASDEVALGCRSGGGLLERLNVHTKGSVKRARGVGVYLSVEVREF